MNKKDRFIERSKEKFGDKYDHSLVEYKDSTSKVAIRCNEHDLVFYQSPSEHLRGKNGCDACKTKKPYDTDSFINRSKEVHGNKYDYSETYYENSTKKVTIICPEHGSFEQTPINHMRGQGCPDCGTLKSNKPKKYSADDFIKKAKKVHGDKYDYSKVNYKDSTQKVIIICNEHGEFTKSPSKHLRGQGCPNCSIDLKKKKLNYDVHEFIELSKQIHGDKYDYSNVEYINSHEKVKIICPEHGQFEQRPNGHLSGHGCQNCTSSVSNSEIEINDFLKDNGVDTITSSMSVIPPYQLDIYIPSHDLAIEFNGLYWHNELSIDKDYHLKKTKECEGKGIELIHIFEDEWIYRSDVVRSILLNKLGLTSNKLYGRKCFVHEITTSEAREFCEQNHLQGYVDSSIKLGLFHGNELVSVMTFGKLRKALNSNGGDREYEMLRFCNKLYNNVIGGGDKLFKHFINNFKPIIIKTYADRRYANGNIYEKLGFRKVRTNPPNYWYIDRKKREHRFSYRKDRLVKEGFDPNKSEHQIMFERGIYRIYDCGTETWIWDFN